MGVVPVVKFNESDQPEFFKELRSRVNQHFKDKKITRQANLNMKVKTVFMLALYFVPLVLMLTNIVTSIWGVLGLWAVMGFGMSGIGLSIMHDANHGAYSKKKRVNDVVGFVLNFIGGYPLNWRIQHNVLHHSFTNIDGYDEDIEKKGIVRFSPDQERKPFFKYQLYYTPLLYMVLTLFWFVYKDYDQLVRYNKMNLLKAQGITFKQGLIQIIFHKLWYIGLTIALPILLIDLPWGYLILGFLIMQFICGMILALIFQSAHVIEETDFYQVDQTGSVENNWAIHQMRTTANFANGSTVFSWLIGGLNYQIEHHLFPSICHVHYRSIAPIVKKTANEFNVPYHEHKTFLKALKSHFNLLNDLGTGEYDKRNKKAA